MLYKGILDLGNAAVGGDFGGVILNFGLHDFFDGHIKKVEKILDIPLGTVHTLIPLVRNPHRGVDKRL